VGVDRRTGAASLPALLIVGIAVVCIAALAGDAAAGGNAPLVLDHAEFVKTIREGTDTEAAMPKPWQSRTLPDLWRSHGMADFGYGWYRLSFALGERPAVPWAIYVDFAQSSYSIRLNGTEVATDVDFDAPVLHPRAIVPLIVTFPTELLRAGANQIDVRLRVEQDSHGGLSKIEVGPRDRLESRFFEARFWRAGLPGALNLAVLAAAIFMLLLWARRPTETLFGWFSALALVWALRGIYVAGDDHLLRALHARLGFASNDLFLGATLVLGCALLLVVVDRYARRPQHGLEVGALAFCGFTTLLVAGMGRPGLEALEAPWNAIAAVLVLLAMRSAVTATLKGLHWPDALIVLGLMFLFTTAVHDALVAADVVAYTPSTWLVFGPPVMLAAVVLALGGRWFQAFDEAGRLNRELENRVAERARDIERQYREIAALQRRSAVAEERERLMRDMHDGVGSQLMTTLYALERGDIPAREVGDLLRQCIEDLRLVIDSLEDSEDSLASALASLRYRIEPRLAAAGLELTWEVSAQAGAGLAPDAVLHVLRVVQEALTNAVKHAGATRLRVRVDHDESGALFVDVTDNGVGMASIGRAARNGGRGVENMRERARSLGGELDLTAGDSGTSVRLRMPAVGPSAPRGAEA
jgi:signal transduction histidine kinase